MAAEAELPPPVDVSVKDGVWHDGKVHAPKLQESSPPRTRPAAQVVLHVVLCAAAQTPTMERPRGRAGVEQLLGRQRLVDQVPRVQVTVGGVLW